MKKTTLVIENVQPLLNCGRYPVKRVAGQTMRVSADVFKDGHDAIAVMLQWRQVGTRSWREIQMLAEGNDVWSGVFPLEEVADYEFTIEAWPDSYASGGRKFRERVRAGLMIFHQRLSKEPSCSSLGPSGPGARLGRRS